MADSRRFQAQINAIMELMTQTVVKQICTLVESDVAGLKKELEHARRRRDAFGDKMRVLENEVAMLRGAKRSGARKGYRSVCIQTDDSPSITEVFDKEWSASLWDGGKSRHEQNTVNMDPVKSDEKGNEEEQQKTDNFNVQPIKDEQPELDIVSISTQTKTTVGATKMKMLAAVSVGCYNREYQANDNNNHYNPYTQPMLTDVPAASTTAFICMDGTVQDLLLPNHEQSLLNDHCVPIEFIDGENAHTLAFHEQHKNFVMSREHMASSGDSQYFNSFSTRNQPGKIKYVCPECGKTFHRQNGLTLHMKSHRRKKAIECRRKKLLKVQKILRPEKLSEKPIQGFSCEICGKLLLSRDTLRVHYNVHAGERPYSCSFCGRGFTQKGNLNSHERIHRGERPYVCTTCGKGFTQKGNMTKHLAIHNKIKTIQIKRAAEK